MSSNNNFTAQEELELLLIKNNVPEDIIEKIKKYDKKDLFTGAFISFTAIYGAQYYTVYEQKNGELYLLTDVKILANYDAPQVGPKEISVRIKENHTNKHDADYVGTHKGEYFPVALDYYDTFLHIDLSDYDWNLINIEDIFKKDGIDLTGEELQQKLKEVYDSDKPWIESFAIPQYKLNKQLSADWGGWFYRNFAKGVYPKKLEKSPTYETEIVEGCTVGRAPVNIIVDNLSDGQHELVILAFGYDKILMSQPIKVNIDGKPDEEDPSNKAEKEKEELEKKLENLNTQYDDIESVFTMHEEVKDRCDDMVISEEVFEKAIKSVRILDNQIVVNDPIESEYVALKKWKELIDADISIRQENENKNPNITPKLKDLMPFEPKLDEETGEIIEPTTHFHYYENGEQIYVGYDKEIKKPEDTDNNFGLTNYISYVDNIIENLNEDIQLIQPLTQQKFSELFDGTVSGPLGIRTASQLVEKYAEAVDTSLDKYNQVVNEIKKISDDWNNYNAKIDSLDNLKKYINSFNDATPYDIKKVTFSSYDARKYDEAAALYSNIISELASYNNLNTAINRFGDFVEFSESNREIKELCNKLSEKALDFINFSSPINDVDSEDIILGSEAAKSFVKLFENHFKSLKQSFIQILPSRQYNALYQKYEWVLYNYKNIPQDYEKAIADFLVEFSNIKDKYKDNYYTEEEYYENIVSRTEPEVNELIKKYSFPEYLVPFGDNIKINYAIAEALLSAEFNSSLQVNVSNSLSENDSLKPSRQYQDIHQFLSNIKKFQIIYEKYLEFEKEYYNLKKEDQIISLNDYDKSLNDIHNICTSLYENISKNISANLYTNSLLISQLKKQINKINSIIDNLNSLNNEIYLQDVKLEALSSILSENESEYNINLENIRKKYLNLYNGQTLSDDEKKLLPLIPDLIYFHGKCFELSKRLSPHFTEILNALDDLMIYYGGNEGHEGVIRGTQRDIDELDKIIDKEIDLEDIPDITDNSYTNQTYYKYGEPNTYPENGKDDNRLIDINSDKNNYWNYATKVFLPNQNTEKIQLKNPNDHLKSFVMYMKKYLDRSIGSIASLMLLNQGNTVIENDTSSGTSNEDDVMGDISTHIDTNADLPIAIRLYTPVDNRGKCNKIIFAFNIDKIKFTDNIETTVNKIQENIEDFLDEEYSLFDKENLSVSKCCKRYYIYDYSGEVNDSGSVDHNANLTLFDEEYEFIYDIQTGVYPLYSSNNLIVEKLFKTIIENDGEKEEVYEWSVPEVASEDVINFFKWSNIFYSPTKENLNMKNFDYVFYTANILGNYVHLLGYNYIKTFIDGSKQEVWYPKGGNNVFSLYPFGEYYFDTKQNTGIEHAVYTRLPENVLKENGINDDYKTLNITTPYSSISLSHIFDEFTVIKYPEDNSNIIEYNVDIPGARTIQLEFSTVKNARFYDAVTTINGKTVQIIPTQEIPFKEHIGPEKYIIKTSINIIGSAEEQQFQVRAFNTKSNVIINDYLTPVPKIISNYDNFTSTYFKSMVTSDIPKHLFHQGVIYDNDAPKLHKNEARWLIGYAVGKQLVFGSIRIDKDSEEDFEEVKTASSQISTKFKNKKIPTQNSSSTLELLGKEKYIQDIMKFIDKPINASVSVVANLADEDRIERLGIIRNIRRFQSLLRDIVESLVNMMFQMPDIQGLNGESLTFDDIMSNMTGGRSEENPFDATKDIGKDLNAAFGTSMDLTSNLNKELKYATAALNGGFTDPPIKISKPEDLCFPGAALICVPKIIKIFPGLTEWAFMFSEIIATIAAEILAAVGKFPSHFSVLCTIQKNGSKSNSVSKAIKAISCLVSCLLRGDAFIPMLREIENFRDELRDMNCMNCHKFGPALLEKISNLISKGMSFAEGGFEAMGAVDSLLNVLKQGLFSISFGLGCGASTIESATGSCSDWLDIFLPDFMDKLRKVESALKKAEKLAGDLGENVPGSLKEMFSFTSAISSMFDELTSKAKKDLEKSGKSAERKQRKYCGGGVVLPTDGTISEMNYLNITTSNKLREADEILNSWFKGFNFKEETVPEAAPKTKLQLLEEKKDKLTAEIEVLDAAIENMKQIDDASYDKNGNFVTEQLFIETIEDCLKKGDTVSERYRIAFNSLTVIRNAPKGSPYTSKEKTAKGESITPELVDSSVSYKIVWGKLVEQKSKLEKQLNTCISQINEAKKKEDAKKNKEAEEAFQKIAALLGSKTAELQEIITHNIDTIDRFTQDHADINNEVSQGQSLSQKVDLLSSKLDELVYAAAKKYLSVTELRTTTEYNVAISLMNEKEKAEYNTLLKKRDDLSNQLKSVESSGLTLKTYNYSDFSKVLNIYRKSFQNINDSSMQMHFKFPLLLKIHRSILQNLVVRFGLGDPNVIKNYDYDYDYLTNNESSMAHHYNKMVKLLNDYPEQFNAASIVDENQEPPKYSKFEKSSKFYYKHDIEA